MSINWTSMAPSRWVRRERPVDKRRRRRRTRGEIDDGYKPEIPAPSANLLLSPQTFFSGGDWGWNNIASVSRTENGIDETPNAASIAVKTATNGSGLISQTVAVAATTNPYTVVGYYRKQSVDAGIYSGVLLYFPNAGTFGNIHFNPFGGHAIPRAGQVPPAWEIVDYNANYWRLSVQMNNDNETSVYAATNVVWSDTPGGANNPLMQGDLTIAQMELYANATVADLRNVEPTPPPFQP